MLAFLVSQMFPGTLMLIPLFIIIVKWLGLGNTFWGLVIVYATTAIPFCVWMLKGYFDTIPIDIEESARIDGASPRRSSCASSCRWPSRPSRSPRCSRS
jgi:arabinogalactan oligomer/maltooligosaccharide transport system permease protein